MYDEPARILWQSKRRERKKEKRKKREREREIYINR